MADRVLLHRCRAELDQRFTTLRTHRAATERLEAELATIATLGYGGYFLTVAEVVDLIKEMGVRVAARGSGAGSLVNHLLGISGVNPLEHGLIMERFLSPLRQALPDIDIDVESARRTEIYTRILERFGGQRCVAVSMMDTYRVRHAVRDVGAALGLPPGEIDAFAKAFPHIRARDARAALADLPELRSSGMGRLAAQGRLDGFLDLVEALDGLPRHVALHPCGVLLSDGSLLDRTPVEASWMGFPMSQFDKDAVEEMGFLKLDVLGIRMQSAMAHALDEVVRIGGEPIVLDAVAAGRPGHLRDDPHHPHPGLLPDRVTRPARADRQVRPRDLRRHHRGHLAVPARPGEVRHGHPVPAGAAGLGGRRPDPSRPRAGDRRDPRRGRLPRAGHRHHRGDDRVQPRPGRRGPPDDGLPGGPGPGPGLVLPAGAGPRLLPRGGRAGLGRAARLRLVRVLQGPRGRVRPAHLPVGLVEGPPPGGVPGRGAHPRPGHVPQAADPRRRPQPGDQHPGPGRQPLGDRLPGRAPARPRRPARRCPACPTAAPMGSGCR